MSNLFGWCLPPDQFHDKCHVVSVSGLRCSCRGHYGSDAEYEAHWGRPQPPTEDDKERSK